MPPRTQASRNPKKKKKKCRPGKWQHQKNALVAVADRKNPRGPPPGAPGVFDEMLKKPCPYHRGPTKHTLEECTMMRRYFSRGGQPKDDAKKKVADAQEGDGKDNGFPEVKNCFMIFGGRSAQLTTCQRKHKHREVYATEPATLLFLNWSEEAITFGRDDHSDYILNPGHPLVIDPVIGNARLTKVLMDGDSGLNILYAKTLDLMGISRPQL
jgi:hypothetical protein